jgi:tripartite-type tricarboxylate transporter receptor subunit TctC
MKISQETALIALSCLAMLAPWSASAQGAYPNKPIRVIVPFAAGSTTDIIARAISDKMSQSMGQTLVIDNRGGASGTLVSQSSATHLNAEKFKRGAGQSCRALTCPLT